MEQQFEDSQMFSAGDRKSVAIECELFHPRICDYHHWVWGVLYLWAGGHRLGEERMDCALAIPAGTLLKIWLSRGRLREEQLRGAYEEAFRFYWKTLYSDEYTPDSQLWRHEVCPLGEQAHDGWIGFLVEDRDNDQFIWQGPDDVVHGVTFTPGEFHEVCRQFIVWLADRSFEFREHVARTLRETQEA